MDETQSRTFICVLYSVTYTKQLWVLIYMYTRDATIRTVQLDLNFKKTRVCLTRGTTRA